MPDRLIDRIKLPDAVRELSEKDCQRLAGEIRDVIKEVLPKTGGHLASNLGVVELTIALHRVFDFKKDHLILDVGHQVYPHKILTGRLERFSTLRQKDGISGFPNPAESEYDPFVVGHAGTSISSALGLAIAGDELKDNGHAVAVIGDGSICGLAFEGMNHAGELKKKMLVILNDNRMAISPTVGAISKYLNRLRTDEYYQATVDEVMNSLHRIPLVGEKLEQMAERVVESLKSGILGGQIFRDLGFHYYGPIDGHDISELEQSLRNLKDHDGSVLLHVLTEKGRGSPEAESDPSRYHGLGKLPPDGKKTSDTLSWSEAFVDAMLVEAESNDKIRAITAAMTHGTKLDAFAQRFPKRTVDTGIAEAHAVTMASGMAKGGLKPVVLIYSTFLQRGYDSIMHDVCLQPDMGVVFAVDRGGLVGDDGPTHHGIFDIAYLRHLPRMILMSPRDARELAEMFHWAIQQNAPVAIRYPRGNVPEETRGGPRPPLRAGVPEVLSHGKTVAVFAYGSLLNEALKAAQKLEEDGISTTLVNMRFAKPLDASAYLPLLRSHDAVMTLEEHALHGGAGSALLELASENNAVPPAFVRLGVPDRFIHHADRAELLHELNLDAEGIEAKLRELCESLPGREVR